MVIINCSIIRFSQSWHALLISFPRVLKIRLFNVQIWFSKPFQELFIRNPKEVISKSGLGNLPIKWDLPAKAFGNAFL